MTDGQDFYEERLEKIQTLLSEIMGRAGETDGDIDQFMADCIKTNESLRKIVRYINRFTYISVEIGGNPNCNCEAGDNAESLDHDSNCASWLPLVGPTG